MVEEGRIRGHVEKGGAWRDSIVHAILEHEWESLTTLASIVELPN